ncbi:MAG: selenocysteine-specific translation elongation factor [Herminiimonas sp.]|nr:selenocysteine-specific translation elongation factor [Herminiimonas sp.]
MIVATAGHVDHGKTTLVKLLTGIDTDRLQEEKRRGMSIETGFAYADLGAGRPVGFVDVPGHERFVRNMLAGVGAVDFALLVVAADDGPMPQTIEHLAILELLGVMHGAVVLTKIDRVTPERVIAAQAEVAALLAPTSLRGAPVFQVAALEGGGVDALRDHLAAVARAISPRAAAGNFRLAIDRCFSLAGVGTVVTGTVLSGRVEVGDQLVVSPQGGAVRVRGIHVHDQPAQFAEAGWRCALNLAGSDLKRIDPARGDWIVAAPAHAPTARFDARVTVPASAARALAHWTAVHLHVGAAVVNARIALLAQHAIEPGATALAQIVAEGPVVVALGDRFILRDHAAAHTIGGGVVLDPVGAVRGRAKPLRTAQLAALEQPTPALALAALLELPGEGVPLAWFAQAWNLTPHEQSGLLQQDLTVYLHGSQSYAIAASRWAALRASLLTCLQQWHVIHSDSVGPSAPMLAAQLGMRLLTPALHAALRCLTVEGSIVCEGISLRLAGHQARLGDADAALLQRVADILRVAGNRPPVIGELAKILTLEQAVLAEFLERASRLGHLVRIAKNRFFLPETMTMLTDVAARLASESDQQLFDAASYRDRSGIGRNVTIEVLEFMDRARITQYAGGKRRMIG